MPRFFISESNINNNKIEIDNMDANHIINVLRSKVNDEITICDGNYKEYFCRISKIEKYKVYLDVISSSKSKSEPLTKITLFQGLPKSDKFELIIQKCVEIGIHEIYPLETKNIVVKPDKFSKKMERYAKISESAAKQSGRGIIPKINEPINLKDSVEIIHSFDKSFVCYENEVEKSGEILSKLDKSCKNIGIFIGPEGGFQKKEINFLESKGVISVSLGNRILRTETAGFVFLTILLYELGDF